MDIKIVKRKSEEMEISIDILVFNIQGHNSLDDVIKLVKEEYKNQFNICTAPIDNTCRYVD